MSGYGIEYGNYNRDSHEFHEAHENDNIKLATRPQYITNRWLYIVSIYGCLLFALTLSISLLNLTTPFSEFYIFLDTTMSASYIISITILVSFMIYIFLNRRKTYEMAIINPDFNETEIIYSLRGENISNYLKFGVILIGACSILFSIFKSNFDFLLESKCNNVSEAILGITQILFFLTQIIFIIKYNMLVMLVHCRITKLILAQIIFTDIMTWTKISLSKISELYKLSSNSKCRNKFTYKLSHYFTPSVAEFMIVCMAVLYETLFRVGKVSLINTHEEIHESIMSQLARNLVGLIIAMLSVLTTLEIFLIILISQNDFVIEDIMKAHMFEEIFLYLIGLTASFLLFKLTKEFKYSFPYYISTVDVNLLFISAFFSIIYCVQIMVHTYYLMSLIKMGNNQPVEQLIMSFRAAASIIEIINIIVQTFVIFDGFHRCMINTIGCSEKPGQNIIATMIGLNFSLWLIKSLQLKKGDVFFNGYKITEQLTRDSNPLMNFFLFFTMPISILYRYHSSVCLSNIFTRMYEDESERFESILRADGFHASFQMEQRLSKDMDKTQRKVSSIFTNSAVTPGKKTSGIKQFVHRPSMIHLSNAKKRIQSSKLLSRKLGKKLHLLKEDKNSD